MRLTLSEVNSMRLVHVANPLAMSKITAQGFSGRDLGNMLVRTIRCSFGRNMSVIDAVQTAQDIKSRDLKAYAHFYIAFNLMCDAAARAGNIDRLLRFACQNRNIGWDRLDKNPEQCSLYVKMLDEWFPLLQDVSVEIDGNYCGLGSGSDEKRRQAIYDSINKKRIPGKGIASMSVFMRSGFRRDQAYHYDCISYVFGGVKSVSIPWRTSDGNVTVLKGYSSQKHPERGDLVLYFFNGEVRHAGIYLGEGMVISKYAYWHIFVHGIYDVPLTWGIPETFRPEGKETGTIYAGI